MTTSAVTVSGATVREIARAVATGETSPNEVLDGVIQRIEATEPTIQAWSRLEVSVARAEAEKLTAEAKAGRLRGPLHGVPVAVKDEFHIAGMPTLFRGPDAPIEPLDAGVVTKLRAAGAIIVGKTHMPVGGKMPPTRNPWNPAHTAGGSSSGSGAVVGARVVPLAIGEQTGGSNLRPAAYCGVTAIKPSYGRISRFGCYPFTWSKDTVGLIGLTMEDLALALSCLAGPDPLDPTTLPDPPPAADLGVAAIQPPRIGVVRNFFPQRTEAYMNDAIDSGAAQLKDAGATVDDFLLPEDFELAWQAARLAGGEIEALHAAKKAVTPPAPDKLTGVELLPVTYYIQARRVRNWLVGRLAPLFARYDALLMATAPGEAPEGLETTGDATLLAPWTFLGFPAITVNGGLGPKGLPLGLQLVGGPKQDYALLQTGWWAEQVLGLLPAPAIP